MGDQIEVEPLPPAPDAEPSVSSAKTTKPDPELATEIIEQQMATAINEVFGQFLPPHLSGLSLANDAVAALLALKGDKGHKLLFTRYDLFQIFGIQQRKMLGEERL